SGARLSRALNKPLYVEHDLHEWLPQKDPLADYDERILAEAKKTLSGTAPPPEPAPCESLDDVRGRVLGGLRRYKRVNTRIVVARRIRAVAPLVDPAAIVPLSLDLDGEAPGPAVESPP